MALKDTILTQGSSGAVTANQTAASITTPMLVGGGIRNTALFVEVLVTAASGTSPTAIYSIASSSTSGGTYTTFATSGAAAAMVTGGRLSFGINPTNDNAYFKVFLSTIGGTSPSVTYIASLTETQP